MNVSGVLVVDKRAGFTSHDIVAQARRAFATRRVGHAGTLDPMATGVLIVAVGEATKLVPWLTEHDKEYVAEITLGSETDTLDAEGEVFRRAEVPHFDRDRVQEVASRFVGEQDQVPPVFSAIKVGGVALHRRARRGEELAPAPRHVVLHEVETLSVTGPTLRMRLACGRGFYVRSFARDLAVALGTVGHLSALRRTRSGAFSVGEAIESGVLENASRAEEVVRPMLEERLVPLLAACDGLARAVLDDATVTLVRHGKPIPSEAIHLAVPMGDAGVCAFADEHGSLVAIARREADVWRVVRGFGGRQDAAR